MKNMFKRNQIMITALAIMIAVAGYLNFAGTKLGEEEIASTAGSAEEDVTALLDLSEEDIVSDIESLDSDAVAAENYLDTGMADGEVAIASEYLDEGQAEAYPEEAEAAAGEVEEGEIPGEAVYTSSTGVSSLSGAKLLKEQTRAKNKETLLEIINNANITETQKQEAVDGMVALTQLAEKETAAEILLEAKGFTGVVVTISGDSADVVVNSSSLTDTQCAQIMDIVTRKTGVAAQNVVISPAAAQNAAE